MSTSSVWRTASRPVTKPSRRATSSRSMTVYPRRAKTSHADVFPVPGVPVTAMSTAGTIRLVVKVLAPPHSTGEPVWQPPPPDAIPNEPAGHPPRAGHGERQHQDQDSVR